MRSQKGQTQKLSWEEHWEHVIIYVYYVIIFKCTNFNFKKKFQPDLFMQFSIYICPPKRLKFVSRLMKINKILPYV